MAVVQRLSQRGSDQNPVTPGRSIFCLSPAAPLRGCQASALHSAAVAASQACRKEQQSPWMCCVSLCDSVCGPRVARPGSRLLVAASALAWQHSWQSPAGYPHLHGGSTPAAPLRVCWTGMGVPWGLRASCLVFGCIYFRLHLKPVLQTGM